MYGILLGAIGVGAVGGSLALTWLKDALGPDRLVATGSVGAACRPHPVRAGARARHGDLRVPSRRRVMDRGADEALCLGAGGAARLGARARARRVPDLHFRGDDGRQRDLGKLSAIEGLPIAYFVAAACLILAVPLTWRWKLQTGVGIDFSPATHWRAPAIPRNVENDRGPVLVVVEYRVDAANRAGISRRDRRTGARAKARRRLRVGRLRRRRRRRALRGDVRRRILARIHASARTGEPRRRDAHQPGSPSARGGAAKSPSPSPRSGPTGCGEIMATQATVDFGGHASGFLTLRAPGRDRRSDRRGSRFRPTGGSAPG